MPKLAAIALALTTLAVSTVRAAEMPDLPRSLQISKEIREVRGKPAMSLVPVEQPHVSLSTGGGR